MIESKVVGCVNQPTYLGLIDSGGFVHDEIFARIQKSYKAFAISGYLRCEDVCSVLL